MFRFFCAAGALFVLSLVSSVSVSAATGGMSSCTPGPWAELKGCNFSGDNLSGVVLNWADLDGADLSGTNLTGAHLFRARLAAANLTGADLQKSDLTGAELKDTVVQGAAFLSANLFDTSSGGITGVPASLPTDWAVVSGYLVGPAAGLNFADLSAANLSGGHLKYTYLMYANLAGANLSNAQMRQSFLDHANLTDANLNGADLKNAHVTTAIWDDTICPDGTNSDGDDGTCLNHLSL